MVKDGHAGAVVVDFHGNDNCGPPITFVMIMPIGIWPCSV